MVYLKAAISFVQGHGWYILVILKKLKVMEGNYTLFTFSFFFPIVPFQNYLIKKKYHYPNQFLPISPLGTPLFYRNHQSHESSSFPEELPILRELLPSKKEFMPDSD